MFRLDPIVEKAICRYLGDHLVTDVNPVQSLWSGYGEILRCTLAGSSIQSMIIKHVKLPENSSHPRGWNTDVSHQRKMRSYEIELKWYQGWASYCDEGCRVPQSYMVDNTNCDFLLLLEDLDTAGFSRRIEIPSLSEMFLCLNWLANFHAKFMGHHPQANNDYPLWSSGTYWHLATRQDELAALDDTALHAAAGHIDSILSSCQYQTIVHGDAKLANFCFSENSNAVAAVDFQYVGGGCGMKDVALFISSCLDSDGCRVHETTLLDYYFEQLKSALAGSHAAVDIDALEQQWRALYAFAWADFVRFLKGWSPGHWKLHPYSEKMVGDAIEKLNSIQKKY